MIGRTQVRARLVQLVFSLSLLTISWLAMMATHELGHVIGVVVTGGRVERVVLHPLQISRTDVSPNPHPAIVVWLGPVLGCLLPLAIACVPNRVAAFQNCLRFFAGFCLIANGAYIAMGSFEGIGDCGVMLQTGSPQWLLVGFGTVTIPLGLYTWHKFGSLGEFVRRPSLVSPRLASVTFLVMLAFVAMTSLL